VMGGFSMGVAGLPGPPVIMFYMSSRKPVAVIRANLQLYMFGLDIMFVPMIWLLGWLDVNALVVGGMLVIPYIIANFLGGKLFNPKAEVRFRRVAYIIIGLSAVLGLPLWTA